MVSWLRKIFGIDEYLNKIEDRDRNPDGLTYTQFVEKYPKCRKIAVLCWHLGLYPEELKQELKNLFEEQEQIDKPKKE